MTDPQVPSGEQPAMPAASEQPTMPVPPPVPPQQDWPQPAAAPQAEGPAWGQPQPAPQQGWQQPTPPAGPAWGQPAQPAPQQWPQQVPQPAPQQWAQPAPQAAPQQWPQQAPQPGWGQPAPAQAGWVQPAQAQAPGHSMLRVIVSALFMLAAGVLTLVPAAGFVIGGNKLSDYLNTAQFASVADAVGNALVVVGVVMGVWALLEILASLGMFMRRTWGRALGTIAGLFGGLFMSLVLLGSLSALNAADTVGATPGVSGVVLVAIVGAVFVGYWFTLIACISGGTHFRRG